MRLQPLTALASAGLIASAIATATPAQGAHGQSSQQLQQHPDSVKILKEAQNRYLKYLVESASTRQSSLTRDFVRDLDVFARELPGDDWIVGNQIGFSVQYGAFGEASRRAAECKASLWWCAALQGLVWHRLGDFLAAEKAFDTALETMPREIRCRWGERLTHVLDGELFRKYVDADCEEREILAERLWWLADPLHLMPGNDRRSEHLARVVGLHIHDWHVELRNSRCPARHFTWILRQGWAEFLVFGESGQIRIGDEMKGLQFLPAYETVRSPLDSSPDDWSTDVLRVGSERYQPFYAPFSVLDHQTAFFKRGDSILVVTTLDLTGHEVGKGRGADVGIVLSRNETEAPVIAHASGSGGMFRIETSAAAGEYLVSVEAIGKSGGAARERFGHGLPAANQDGLSMSDVLLFRWEDGFDEDPGHILPHMLGSTRLQRGSHVGVFWEMYGGTSEDDIEIAINISPVNRGLLRRIGETFSLVRRQETAGVQWQEVSGETALARRALRVDLSSLGPGHYMLQVEAGAPGSEPAISQRRMEIVE